MALFRPSNRLSNRKKKGEPMDSPHPQKSRILVSASSKHGATKEIAERIGSDLRGRGHEVTVSPPDQVIDVSHYDAVVLGSAVYAGHWMGAAKDLAKRLGRLDQRPPTWLFSSGPIGDPPKPEEDPVDVAEILAASSARDHRVFSGKIDKSKLSFAEKAILAAVRAPEGDFREWDQISDWANAIADSLTKETAAR
jgi:menaquinone-dependent protoporphyrinogen oxidase